MINVCWLRKSILTHQVVAQFVLGWISKSTGAALHPVTVQPIRGRPASLEQGHNFRGYEFQTKFQHLALSEDSWKPWIEEEQHNRCSICLSLPLQTKQEELYQPVQDSVNDVRFRVDGKHHGRV